MAAAKVGSADAYKEARADLKWAIRALASARSHFLSLTYENRLADIENQVIHFRNEIEPLTKEEG